VGVPEVAKCPGAAERLRLYAAGLAVSKKNDSRGSDM
jgi:hypothetical protein